MTQMNDEGVSEKRSVTLVVSTKIPKPERGQLQSRTTLANVEFGGDEWLDWSQGSNVIFEITSNKKPLEAKVLGVKASAPREVIPWPTLWLDFSLGVWPTPHSRTRALVEACQQVLDRLGDDLHLGPPPRLPFTKREREVTEPTQVVVTYRNETQFKQAVQTLLDRDWEGEIEDFENLWWAAMSAPSPRRSVRQLQRTWNASKVRRHCFELFEEFAERHGEGCLSDSTLYLAAGAMLHGKQVFTNESLAEIEALLSDQDFVAGEELVILLEDA